MDLKALSYFIAVVEEGSITGAAGRCFVAQPSISHAINKLETELELTLFIRQKRGVTITPEGNAFSTIPLSSSTSFSLIDTFEYFEYIIFMVISTGSTHENYRI